MVSGDNYYINDTTRRRNMNSHKKFWLSLICDYQEDPQDGDIDFVLSKAKLMCWTSFISLLVLALSLIKGIKYDPSTLTISVDVLKTIFTTTFLYEGFKRGVKVYEEKNSQ